jgi:hypothetical protein
MLTQSIVLAQSSLDGWEKISEEDDITVYMKPPSEHGTVSVRGDAVLNANIDDVFTVLANNSEAPQWMPFVVERYDLVQLSQNSRLEYTHVYLPWPLKDRYWLNRSEASPLPEGGWHITTKSIDDPKPEWLRDDKVLAYMYFSELYLKPVADGTKTYITIELNTDPRGMLPKWLVNRQQRGWPRAFFKGLKKQLKVHNLLH